MGGLGNTDTSRHPSKADITVESHPWGHARGQPAHCLCFCVLCDTLLCRDDLFIANKDEFDRRVKLFLEERWRAVMTKLWIWHGRSVNVYPLCITASYSVVSAVPVSSYLPRWRLTRQEAKHHFSNNSQCLFWFIWGGRVCKFNACRTVEISFRRKWLLRLQTHDPSIDPMPEIILITL